MEYEKCREGLKGKNDAKYISLFSSFGVISAYKKGDCIKLSFPNNTSNERNRLPEVLTLPLMDKETFRDFVEALEAINWWFKGVVT